MNETLSKSILGHDTENSSAINNWCLFTNKSVIKCFTKYEKKMHRKKITVSYNCFRVNFWKEGNRMGKFHRLMFRYILYTLDTFSIIGQS